MPFFNPGQNTDDDYSQNPEDTATVSPLIAMHCFGLSITFHFIYTIIYGQNFCLKILRRPSNPAKILDLPEDYKTGCQFFILLYFVFFFRYYYKQTVLHLTSPSFLSTFTENICNFLVLRLFTSCF